MCASITLLVENTACLGSGRGIWAEHGLSYWIDTGKSRVLFDTGASGDVLLHNASKMKIDIAQADAIVLSHGHIDHVGGLETVLGINATAPLYLHPAAPDAKYTGRPGTVIHRSDTAFFTERRYSQPLEATGDNITLKKTGSCHVTAAPSRKIVESREPLEVAPGVRMTGEVPRTNDFENTGGPFMKDPECRIPDLLPDDQSLYIATDKGTIVITGCAHAGLINTLDYVKKLTGGAPIRFVVGGTHLETASKERMARTFAELKRLGVTEIHPCHCTGMLQSVKLCESVGGESKPGYAGLKLEW